MFFAMILSFAFVLLLPHPAFAWGPATHLEVATAVLNDAAGFALPLRALLENFPYDFLYGNISADIVVGKNLVEELKHCHHWKMGFKLLRKAQNDPQKAFAYGYLSHLAADTVAHNQFIPEMMLRSFSTNILRHIYWELRFDALADKRTWQLPKKILKEIDPENDLLLDSIIEDSPLSFKTNKRIFSGLHSIQSFEHWHIMLTLLSASSKWSLDGEDREKYFNASLDSVKDFLLNQHGAACCKKDPTGKHSLNAAAHMRRRLKSIRRQGKDWEEALDNALRWIDSPKA